MANTFKNYRTLIAALKKHAPPAYPISVTRKRLPNKIEGLCWKHGKKFCINIERSINEARAMDVVLHEWAHALAWNDLLDNAKTDDEFNKLAHDASWGVAYSRVYQIYEQQFLPNIA